MPDLNVMYTATAIAQSKENSCWAAASASMLSWQRNVPYDELAAATAAGEYFVQAFNANVGVLGKEIVELAKRLNLQTEVPQNFTANGYYKLLQAHGPLWIGTAIFGVERVYRHVRIMYGLSGDGSFDNTSVWLIDPDGGRKYTESVAEFAKEVEEIAKQDLDVGADLLPQVLRFP